MASPQAFYELKCSCNQYPWGRQGSNSLSATLCSKQPGYGSEGPKSDFKIDENAVYAEMWMGTYPVLPSYIKETGEDLQDVLDKYPDQLIGQNAIKKHGHTKIPYLPKVLSIAKALPLQVHPNKNLTAKLHEKDPQNFTDPNHKPEIALALSKFEAFCGWKPLPDIAPIFQLDFLQKFLPENITSAANFTDQTLKAVVRSMLKASDADIRAAYSGLASAPASKFGASSYIPELAPRLASQYDAADPGVLVALLCMNYLVLQPGQAIYIPADGIHAYLSGDIIECMARSNNVLNTGFCPAAERSNADLFVETLSFAPHNKDDALLLPQPHQGSKNGKTERLAPPLSEFHMLQTTLKAGEREVIEALGGPGIMIATRGGATMKANGKAVGLKEGHVFFIAQGVELEFEAGKDGLLMHEAFVE